MKHLILLITCLLFPTMALSFDGNPAIQVNAFFTAMTKDSNKAIDDLYSNNPAMQQKMQTLTVMKTQLASVTTFFGSYLGFEIIAEEELSPSLVRISAIAKYELHPVGWEFYFYKPRNKWIISQALFADQFQNIANKK